MLEETSQAGGTSTTTDHSFTLRMFWVRGNVTAKMLSFLSTLHHSSVIIDGPGRDINAGPGRRQKFAILGFHPECTDNQLTMYNDSR